jgi:hypothetical protein
MLMLGDDGRPCHAVELPGVEAHALGRIDGRRGGDGVREQVGHALVLGERPIVGRTCARAGAAAGAGAAAAAAEVREGIEVRSFLKRACRGCVSGRAHVGRGVAVAVAVAVATQARARARARQWASRQVGSGQSAGSESSKGSTSNVHMLPCPRPLP